MSRMKAITKGKLGNLLSKVRERLEILYGERIQSIIIYGSHAQGRETEDSDIDIAVVLDGSVNRVREMDKIKDSIYDLELESGELISVYPVSRDEYENSIWPLLYHIRGEGVEI